MNAPRVGDDVMYVPDCTGDMCEHETVFDRSARIHQVYNDGTVGLTVFHPNSIALVHHVRHGGPGQLRSWYRREEHP